MLSLRDRFENIRIIILGGSEAWMVADKLAEADVPVVIDITSNLPRSFESLGSTLENAVRLHTAGVTIAMISGGFVTSHNARLAVQSAGLAMAYGLDTWSALATITINPAKIFGIDDHYGSIKAGMDADLVIWDGHPLEVMSSPDVVIIKGQQMLMESRQTKLRDRYQDLKNKRDDALAYSK